jgi:hypothetical protein
LSSFRPCQYLTFTLTSVGTNKTGKVIMGYQSVNPFDNKAGQSFADLTDKQLEDKLALATSCFAEWKHTSYAERAAIVNKAAKLLLEQAGHFAHIMTSEMGKRISEAKGEVEFSSQILTYYAKNAERFLADAPLHPSHGEGHMESSPIGVVLPTGAGGRAASDGGQHGGGEARRMRAAMRHRVREAVAGCRRASRALHQPADLACAIRPHHR